MSNIKKIISTMLIAVLLLSIIPFGATEHVEPTPTEASAPVEESAPSEQSELTEVPVSTEAPPAPTEAPAPTEQAPTEPPTPTEAPSLTEAPPVATEIPIEEPTIAPAVEEPTITPTEQPTQQPSPSPTVQAEIVDKTGWEYAPNEATVYPEEIGLGNSFQVNLNAYNASGGTGKFTYAFYIYNGNTIEHKSAYSSYEAITDKAPISYKYTPKTTGKYHALVFIKNEKGEIRTLKTIRMVNVIETIMPINVMASVLNGAYPGNIVLGDEKRFFIGSGGGNEATPHMHAYYVYKNNQLIERFPYKQANDSGEVGFESEVFYTPKSPGKYKFTVFAKDSSGKAASYTTEEFLVTASELSVRANVNKNVVLGETANIVAEARGGSGTYQYAYYVYKNNAVIQRVWYTANAQFKYTPKSVGTYNVKVFVKDSLGNITTDTTQDFLVTSTPLVTLNVRFKGVYSDPHYNNCIYYSVEADGGVPPYKYAYYIYKNNSIVEKLPYIDGDDNVLYGYGDNSSYIPKNSGTYKILAFVKDATGIIKTAVSEDIEFNNDLIMVRAPFIPYSIFIGEGMYVQTYVKYGEGFYKYAYYIYKDDKLLKKLPYSNNANFVYKPETIGTYRIQVFVKDDSGKIVYGTSNNCNVMEYEGYTKPPTIEEVDVDITRFCLPNDQIYVETYAYGGGEPYQCAYYIYFNNNLVKKTAYSEFEYDRYFNFTAKNIGDYHVIAFVKDVTGKIVYKKSNTCVVSNNQPPYYKEMNVNLNIFRTTPVLETYCNVN
ncbi:MAG: hypothetical protein GYA87_08690, partial [Christensenellaceae bacterium]|nr:hypothetical protein [Christensenellaceae bacterium]